MLFRGFFTFSRKIVARKFGVFFYFAATCGELRRFAALAMVALAAAFASSDEGVTNSLVGTTWTCPGFGKLVFLSEHYVEDQYGPGDVTGLQYVYSYPDIVFRSAWGDYRGFVDGNTMTMETYSSGMIMCTRD